MKLDVILPRVFDFTLDGKIISNPNNLQDYFFNIEYSLRLVLVKDENSNSEDIIDIDYYGDDDTLISNKIYFDTEFKLNAFTKVQYNIAKSYLKMSTTDIEENNSVEIDIQIPTTISVNGVKYYLTLYFTEDDVDFDYVSFDKYTDKISSILFLDIFKDYNVFEYETNSDFKPENLLKAQKTLYDLVKKII